MTSVSKTPSVESVPVKIPPQHSGPTNGITWYQNGQKYTLPLQTGILGGVFALVFKVWTTFNDMQVDVEHVKNAFDNIAQSMASMEKDSKAALDGTHENKELIESNSKSDSDRASEQVSLHAEIDRRLKALELCHTKPKACEL